MKMISSQNMAHKKIIKYWLANILNPQLIKTSSKHCQWESLWILIYIWCLDGWVLKTLYLLSVSDCFLNISASPECLLSSRRWRIQTDKKDNLDEFFSKFDFCVGGCQQQRWSEGPWGSLGKKAKARRGRQE